MAEAGSGLISAFPRLQFSIVPAGEERLRREGPVLPESVHGGGGEGEGGQEVGQGQVHHQDVS